MKKVDLVFCELGNVFGNHTVPNTVFYLGDLDLARTGCPSSGRNPQRLVHKRWPTPFMDPDRFFLVRIRNIGGGHIHTTHEYPLGFAHQRAGQSAGRPRSAVGSPETNGDGVSHTRNLLGIDEPISSHGKPNKCQDNPFATTPFFST
jgi:hypothetical protein